MKNGVKKICAAAISGAMLLGGAGATWAMTGVRQPAAVVQQEKSPAPKEKEAQGVVKDETVYVLTGAQGQVEKIIVSDWLKNSMGSAAIPDRSELTEVETTKGDQTYTDQGDMRVWDAQGEDIYYQGNLQKELPVTLSVTYKLDSREISPQNLAGKSGRVSIRFDYQNNQFQTVEINDKKEKMAVPFAVLTGMLLDNEVFSNVQVSGGRTINDGSRTIVAGIAFPGLRDNLKMDEEKLEIPDSLEIQADVKNFKLDNTVTIATNQVFSRLDMDEVDSEEDLTDLLAQLTDAMAQLTDGSSQLYDGLCTLLDKSGQLADGVDELSNGAGKLEDGAGELSDGAGELSSGAAALSKGLDQLAANSSTLTDGARQVFAALLQTADTQLAAAGLNLPKLTMENYAQVLGGVISSAGPDQVLDQIEGAALDKVTQQVEERQEEIKEAVTEAVQQQVAGQVTQAVRETVLEQVLASQGMTRQQYEAGVASGAIDSATRAAIESAVDAQMEDPGVKGTIGAQTDAQMADPKMEGMIAQKTREQMDLLIQQAMGSSDVKDQISSAIDQANAGLSAIASLKAQLDSYNAFYTGLIQYTGGVSTAQSGAATLSSGAGKLASGASTLYAGTRQLREGTDELAGGVPALIDGVTQLRDGAKALSEGLAEFDQKAVQKIVDAVDGDLEGLLERLREMTKLSRDYRSFSGISDGMDGQVKFIYRTESVQG